MEYKDHVVEEMEVVIHSESSSDSVNKLITTVTVSNQVVTGLMH